MYISIYTYTHIYITCITIYITARGVCVRIGKKSEIKYIILTEINGGCGHRGFLIGKEGLIVKVEGDLIQK